MPGVLEGKVAIVTGASRGIGAGISERFAAEGAAVALVARTVEPRPGLPGTLTETMSRIEAAGGRCIAVQADLADPTRRARIVNETLTALGPVDILVNNAARAFYEPAHAISEKRLRLSFEVNFTGPFDLMQRVIPGMRERGAGWILNLSSTTSVAPAGPPWNDFARNRGVGTYASTKAALERMSLALAAELHDHGIAVNTLAPVAAVLTEAALQLGVIPPDAHTEPLEVMTEAALALCSGDTRLLTGRVALSRPLLDELGIAPRSLDGSAPLEP